MFRRSHHSPLSSQKSEPAPQIPDFAPSKTQSVAEEPITTTTVLEDLGNSESIAKEFEQKLAACHKAGIHYLPKNAAFLHNFSFHQVLQAILYVLFNHDGVRKPAIWFKVCLEDNWQRKKTNAIHFVLSGQLKAYLKQFPLPANIQAR